MTSVITMTIQMKAVPKHWYPLTLHSIITQKVTTSNFCVVVIAIKLMPEKEVQSLKILKLMVDNLNPIEH
jgi:hypothetical protein